MTSVTRTQTVAIVIIILIVVAAVAYITTRQPPPRPETIAFYLPESSPAEEEVYEKIVREMSSERPNLEIDLNVTPGIYHENVLRAYESGLPVDVLYVDSSWASLLIGKNALLPMEELAPREYVEQFHEFLLEPFEGPEGRMYALPARWSMLVLFYNKELLVRAGFDGVGPSWEELFIQAKTITDRTGVPGLALFPDRFDFFLPYALAQGAKEPSFLRISDPNPPAIRAEWFKEPEVVRSLSEWISLYLTGNVEREVAGLEPYVVTPIDVKAESLVEAFVTEKVAIVVADSQMILTLIKAFPSFEYGHDWDIAPLPAGAKGRATVAYVVAIAVTRTTAYRSAAWTLVRRILEEEGQKELLISTGVALPSLKSLSSNELLWPQYRKIMTQISSYDVIMSWFTGRKHTQLVPEIEAIFHRAILGEVTVEVAVNEMYKRALDILTQSL